MTITRIGPLESGQHPIQSQSHRRACWVGGYVEAPAHLGVAVWATHGRCDLQTEEGVLVGITSTEWPPEPEPEPELLPVEERVATLEEALAQTNEAAIAPFESRAEQESINVQQDDAPLDIYEMLGG